jgi:hypothetical protein
MLILDNIQDLINAFKRLDYPDSKRVPSSIYSHVLLEQVDDTTLKLAALVKGDNTVIQYIYSTNTVVGTKYLILWEDLNQITIKFKGQSTGVCIYQNSKGLLLSTFKEYTIKNTPKKLDTIKLNQYTDTLFNNFYLKEVDQNPETNILTIDSISFYQILSNLKNMNSLQISEEFARYITINLDAENTVEVFSDLKNCHSYLSKITCKSTYQKERVIILPGYTVLLLMSIINSKIISKEEYIEVYQEGEYLTFVGILGRVTIKEVKEIEKEQPLNWISKFDKKELSFVCKRVLDLKRTREAIQSQLPKSKELDTKQLTINELDGTIVVSKYKDTLKVEQSSINNEDLNCLTNEWRSINVFADPFHKLLVRLTAVANTNKTDSVENSCVVLSIYEFTKIFKRRPASLRRAKLINEESSSVKYNYIYIDLLNEELLAIDLNFKINLLIYESI